MNAESKPSWNIPDPKQETTFELPAFVSLEDFLEETIEMPEVLVEGLIRKRSVVVLASGSKSYKTWTVLHCALCVSQGVPWLGRTTKKGKVLFINLELTPAELHSRLKVISDRMGIAFDRSMLDICNLRGKASDISDVIPAVIKRCEGRQYALIVPDPIYSMMGKRNENAANEMADFLHHLSWLSEDTGAAVLYTHHFAKGNAAAKEAIDRASGSGVFARHADGVITMTRHKEDSAFTIEAELRSFKRPEPFVIKWDYPMMEFADHLDPTQLKTKAGRPRSYDVQQILDCLPEEGLKAGEWLATAKIRCAISQTTFYELRASAVADGRAEERGKKWFRIHKTVIFKPMPATEVRGEGRAA